MCRGEKFGTPGSIKILRLVFATFEGIKRHYDSSRASPHSFSGFRPRNSGSISPLNFVLLDPRPVFFTRGAEADSIKARSASAARRSARAAIRKSSEATEGTAVFCKPVSSVSASSVCSLNISDSPWDRTCAMFLVASDPLPTPVSTPQLASSFRLAISSASGANRTPVTDAISNENGPASPPPPPPPPRFQFRPPYSRSFRVRAPSPVLARFSKTDSWECKPSPTGQPARTEKPATNPDTMKAENVSRS